MELKRKKINENKLIMVSRLLNQEEKEDLLTWVNLAHKAEKSVKDSIKNASSNPSSPSKTQN